MSIRIFNTRRSTGFTLIEVLVALSLFTMVATAAIGVLLVMINANNKAQNIQTAMFDLAFSLDSLTRDLRTGENYYCGNAGDAALRSDGVSGDCSSGTVKTGIAFDEVGGSVTGTCSSSRRIAYQLSNGALQRSICGLNTWRNVTSSKLEITSFRVMLTGTDTLLDDGDAAAPLATIYIAGRVLGKNVEATDFAVQTTVTQAILDI